MPTEFLEKQYSTIFPGNDQNVHFDKFINEMRAGDEIYLYDNSEEQSTTELVATPKLLRHCRVGANDVDRTAPTNK